MVLIWLLAAGLTRAGQEPPDLTGGLERAAKLERSGDSRAALTAYRSLLPLADRDEAARTRILEALALVETNTGDYQGAVRDAAAASAIHAKNGSVQRQSRALNTAGLASLYAGQYDEAARWLTRAIELSTAADDQEGRAEQLTNLANVHFFTGRYTEASQLYAEALDLTRTRNAEGWSSRRAYLVQMNRAALDQRLGRHEDALAVYRQLEADSPDLRPREQAQILVNEGVLYRNLGDPIKALAAYDRALGLFSRDQHVDGQLGVLKNRGIVQALDLHDFGAARRSFSDALTDALAVGNRREALQAQLYRAETELRADSVGEARADFEAALGRAEALRTPEETWKALYGLGRVELAAGNRGVAVSRLERAAAVIEEIRESIRVPVLKSDFFNDKRDVYDALIAIEVEQPVVARLFDLIERSHSRAWRERLGLSGAIDLAAIQQALPPGVALLDFWSSSSGSAVVIVTRTRTDVRRITVDADAIQQFVDTLGRGPSTTWREQTDSLAASVLPGGPPDDVRHVIVVPDGTLAALPFELLQFGSRLLIERVTVSYMPTAAMLVRQRPHQPRMAPPWRLQLSAFADPLPARSALDTASSLRDRLISSRTEVQAIAKEITGTVRLHLGEENRKAYLYEAQSQAPMLHVASHAVADSNAVERSRIVFSPATLGGGADYLFLKEAYDLRLNGVELVVLSACDTERGRILRGEGLQSFSRAFLAAGARSTVTTLWRVPDAPTAMFMTAFYHDLQRGVPRAEALRNTKLRFRQSDSAFNDPHFWAAFVLTGDGIRPITSPLGWGVLALLAAATIGVGCVAWKFIHRINLFR